MVFFHVSNLGPNINGLALEHLNVEVQCFEVIYLQFFKFFIVLTLQRHTCFCQDL